MKLDHGILNTKDIETTSPRKKINMRLSDRAQMMIFKSYTKNLYSNTIGSVVREIASNSYDAHIAAGVNEPIIIRLATDLTGHLALSFIDVGTGMSPEIIEDVYGVYFESTKNTSDLEHGGFGIGGKTPLAYGSGSFFIVTRYNGIEYAYNIYAGESSPEIDLLYEKETSERNGTEVKVPINDKDAEMFVQEIERQLYYFENIIYEGFAEHGFINLKNDFTILKGKTFLYRGDVINDSMHICLGRVAYPINFQALGLDEDDYRVPVAVQVNIGDINVTMSREALEYSEKTKEYLLTRIAEVKKEIIDMYALQCGSINNITDYINYMNHKYGLYLTSEIKIDISAFLKSGTSIASFDKFPYNTIKPLLTNDGIIEYFFKIKRFGDRTSIFDLNSPVIWDGDFRHLKRLTNAYHVKGEFKRHSNRNFFLKGKHMNRFYVLVKNPACNDMEYHATSIANQNKLTATPQFKKEFAKLYEEVFAYIKSHTEDYDSVIIPEEFKDKSYRKKLLLKQFGEQKISVEDANFSGLKNFTKVQFKKLATFKGRIFYGFNEDNELLRLCYNYFEKMHDSNRIGRVHTSLAKKGILFIRSSKSFIKQIQQLDNALPIQEFGRVIIRRKLLQLTDAVNIGLVKEQYERVHSFFKRSGFKAVDQEIFELNKKVKDEMGIMPNATKIDLSKLIQLLNAMNIKLVVPFSAQVEMDRLLFLTKINDDFFDLLEIRDYDINNLKEDDIKTQLLKKILVK